MSQETSDSTHTWTFWGSIGAVLAAAVCCIGPAILLSLGVTGAWVGWMAELEPFMLGAFIVGAAGYGVTRVVGHRETDHECRDDGCHN